MRRFVQITALSVALLTGLGANAHATVYNEGASGDLSDSPSMPTNIGILALGDNTVIGSSTPSGSLIPDGHGALTIQDNDFFTFKIAAGQQLSYLNLGSNTTIEPGDRFFLGIYPTGSTSVDPTNPTPAGLLGYTLPGTPQIGQNILPDLAASDETGFPALSTHFPGVLGAGSYTVWLVDGDSPVHYDLDLGVTAVPEPSMWMLMIAGLGMTGVTLRRRAGRDPQLNGS